MGHVYNGILAINRNEIEFFVVMWKNLECVIQSEVSQKEKNKYRMLTHIYIESKKIIKMVLMNIAAGQEKRCRGREWT